VSVWLLISINAYAETLTILGVQLANEKDVQCRHRPQFDCLVFSLPDEANRFPDTNRFPDN